MATAHAITGCEFCVTGVLWVVSVWLVNVLHVNDFCVWCQEFCVTSVFCIKCECGVYNLIEVLDIRCLWNI